MASEVGRELLARAEALVPVLRERAAETEALRRIPDETMRDLRDAELFKGLQPRRYGGFEIDLDEGLRITAALGRGCGATGWVHGVFPTIRSSSACIRRPLRKTSGARRPGPSRAPASRRRARRGARRAAFA